tara:strand:- start:558 stop:1064 length:507 start_codon:yes stop_codon:yes gene_type:complete
MSNNNKWIQPDAPPPPLFLGKKERDLVKQVNDELIERVIGQQILYYPIDLETTNFHPIYGEAIKKTFLPPIRVYALVEWNDYSTYYDDSFGLTKNSEIVVHFHKRRLTEDQDLFVREGDFVSYGDFYYEIVTLGEPRQLFGQITQDLTNSLEISAKCTYTSKGVFDGS